MREFSEEYNGVCNDWQWDSCQPDINILQDLYEEAGYKVTRSQAYDLWYLYSEYCSANWIIVRMDTDVSKTFWLLKDVGIFINKFKDD